MIPSLQFKVDFEPILKQLAQGEVRAVIYNDARSSRRFPYFWSVNDGRKGFGPYGATSVTMGRKTLKFFSRGRWWWPKSVGPAAAQNIRERAVEAIMPMLYSMQAHFSGTQAGLVAFVNEAAAIAKHALIQFTPRRSGTLASKYRIEHAK
jgi:hypothetical protein